MKVLVVGGGIAGLTLAAFLEASNIEYEVVEKCPDWSHLGYLISIWDAGRDIMKKLGLAEQFDKFGSPKHAYSVRDGSGRVLREFNFQELYSRYGGAITALSRSALHSLVLNAIPKSKIRMDRTVESFTQEQGAARCVFNDGTEATYDVVVGADGIHSSIRKQAFCDAVEHYEEWRVWYAWIDGKFDQSGAITEYVEAGEFAVVFSAGDKTMACFSAPMSHAIRDEPGDRLENLKRLFQHETFLIPSALEGLAAENIMPTDLIEIHLTTWSKGRVVLLGDSAHNFGPHIGMGGSMALEDAYVLAGELLKASQSGDVRTCLERYERERKRRIHLAERISHRIRNGTLIRSRIYRQIANMFMAHVPDSYITADLDRLLREEI